EGDCQHSGTYNGHPVVVAAGLAAVETFREAGFYDHVRGIAEQLYGGLRAIFARHGLPVRVQGLGARFGMYFGLAPDQPVTNYAEAQQHEKGVFMRFYAAPNRHGVYFHDYGGAPCHHGFCAAMQAAEVEEALARVDRAVAEIATR